jgi:predicted membrane protein
MTDTHPDRTATPEPTAARAGDPSARVRRPAPTKGRRWIVSIFGDITRSGAWAPHSKTSPVAVFGDIDLDVRMATLPPEGITINAIAPFGNVDLIVPDGAEVDLGGFTLFGSKKVAVEGSTSNAVEGAITVRGFSLFGSIKVRSS